MTTTELLAMCKDLSERPTATSLEADMARQQLESEVKLRKDMIALLCVALSQMGELEP
jgi:hypothetical protein